MKKFKDYSSTSYLQEDLNPRIKSILDSKLDPEVKYHTLNFQLGFLHDNNKQTGFTGTPKHGSSRVVYHMSEPHEIVLNGRPVKVKTVAKIAMPSFADKNNSKGDKLLGTLQNEAENNPAANEYSVLRKLPNGEFESNPTGVLAPIFHSHEKNHYMIMGHVDDISEKEFTEMTKTVDHPEGLRHSDVKLSLERNYNEAHGQKDTSIDDETFQRTMRHPLVQRLNNAIHGIGLHPGDLKLENLGKYTDPERGPRITIRDYGYSPKVAETYSKRVWGALNDSFQ